MSVVRLIVKFKKFNWRKETSTCIVFAEKFTQHLRQTCRVKKSETTGLNSFYVCFRCIYIYTFSISLMLSQHSVTTQEALWNDVKSRWENMSHPVLYKWGTSAWVCEGKHQILRYHEIHGFMTKTQHLTEIVKITLSSVMTEIRLHLKQISNIGPFIQSQNLNPTLTIFLFFVFLLYNKLIIWVLIRCSLTLLWLYKC